MNRHDTRRVMHLLAQAGHPATTVATDLGAAEATVAQWATGTRVPTPRQTARLLELVLSYRADVVAEDQLNPRADRLLYTAADLLATAGEQQQKQATRRAAAQQHRARIAATDPFVLAGATADDMPF